MHDIDLYEKSTDSYEELQLKRPDYVGARMALLDLATLHFKGKSNLTIADFCSGTGNNTHLLSQKLSIKKATLIDINKDFLEIAQKSDIKNKVGNLIVIQSNILDTQPKTENDLVISMFAYHHVPDSQKKKYIEVVKDALKVGGLLLLGEIYVPDEKTTIAYYEHLLGAIPQKARTPELEQFLRQTAKSHNFEYKVSRKFAHDQLEDSGLELLDSFKVWPKDESFPKDVGTFVEAWKLSKLIESSG